MSTNKHAIIRYQTLDKCFRNTGKRYYIEDLLEACNTAIFEFDPNSEGIKKDNFTTILGLWNPHKASQFL
ncbi:hypothetical protein [Jejuia pallidilutea]|nr:hypothetical protein [Jejuia pallidilutea]